MGDKLCRVVPITILFLKNESLRLLDRLNCDEVADFADHPANCRSVLELGALVDALESQALQKKDLRLRTSDAAANLSYFEF